ncbi:MAG: acetolactate synthase [SAR202 cluster bacterium Io17-Chloro-G9]|nr:MAG: acetolactate synthase [SAR202 cluster bacterium Io17-Chloro-G9]
MPQMTGGRFLADTMKGYGVTHAFLVPVIARRAMVEMERVGIQRVITHGEKAAAYMADGYARASGRPGVCLAQSVGAVNLAAGLQDAFLGLSPVIAITGHRPPMHRHRNSYQEIDHEQPFSAVTKFSAMVENVEQLPYLVRQAFREATSGAPAPVHLGWQGISGDVIGDGQADLEVIVEEAFMQIPAFRPEPEPERVREAAQVLAGAQRPVIMAGGGVTASGAQQEVVELAEMLSIPVATSLNAKGTIPEDHRLAVGVCGSYSRACANQVVSEADLVLFIGSHTGSQVTLDWKVPALGTPVIQIDIDPSELGRSYPTTVAMQGDAKASVRRLIEALEPMGGHSDWVDRCGQLVQEWREGVSPQANSDAVPIRPERICSELTKTLPSDAILMCDTGHAGIWTGSMVDLKYPGQRYLRAAGSLGWGLPAALGAKCAAPDRPVICFTGDGGFWYHIGELETAARYGINAVILVNDNGALNQNKRGDDAAYQGFEGDPAALYEFSGTDLAKVAESMGCFGIRVDQPGDIQSALEQAMTSGKPAVVDVRTDIDVMAPVPWSP